MADGLKITTFATRYEIAALPVGHRDWRHVAVLVEWRGLDSWAVADSFRNCLGRDGEWSYESVPSERTDEWLAANRYQLEEALSVAQSVAETMTVNGLTAADILAREARLKEENGG